MNRLTRRESDDDDDDDTEVRLTRGEKRRVMKMVEAHEWAEKAWSVLGIGLKWIGAVLVVLVAMKTLFGDWWRPVR